MRAGGSDLVVDDGVQREAREKGCSRMGRPQSFIPINAWSFDRSSERASEREGNSKASSRVETWGNAPACCESASFILFAAAVSVSSLYISAFPVLRIFDPICFD